jgi:DNA mismatch repair ATPase MutS
VLQHLSHETCCCGLLATHYHQLVADHEADKEVALSHMACAVARPEDQQQQQQGGVGSAAEAASGTGTGGSPVEEVTFLYKLTPGEGINLGRGV